MGTLKLVSLGQQKWVHKILLPRDIQVYMYIYSQAIACTFFSEDLSVLQRKSPEPVICIHSSAIISESQLLSKLCASESPKYQTVPGHTHHPVLRTTEYM